MNGQATVIVLGAAVLVTLATGCPGEDPPLLVEATLVSDADECADLCVEITATKGIGVVPGAGVRMAVGEGDLMPAGDTDDNGEALACVEGGRLDLGEHEIRVRVNLGQESAEDIVTVQIHPFGYAWGLLKTGSVPDPPLAPVIERYEDNPVLEPGAEGSWDDFTVMMPSVVPWDDGYLMLYQGRRELEDYHIGAAWSEDGLSWTRLSEDPVIAADEVGDWAGISTGGPSLLEADGELRLWFHAHGDEGTRIAAAHSDDGLTWIMDADEPVLGPGEDDQWDHTAVAHPSVRMRGGIYEMWYASSELQIGHALSEDGLTWTRYCNNPVFVPTGEATWEGDATKSPEVIYDEGLYHLFFSAGAQENWRVGHAVSADGLRWARTGDGPVLPVGDPGTWEEQGTINAASLVEYGEIRLWYTGISVGPSATGVATIVDWE